MKNFLITAMGRTGTLFLATLMNRSKKWTVLHEAGRAPGRPDFGPRSLADIQQRFNRDYYGEVNGFLRFRARDLKVEKMGVILREPVDHWISIANQKLPKTREKCIVQIDNLEKTLHELDFLAKRGARKIHFAPMVSDLAYLKEVFAYFEIPDVELTPSMQTTKINATNIKKYYSLTDFEPFVQKEVLRLQGIYEAI